MADEKNSGRIFDVQRCCSGDGPGIRTTVFLQGCPLHCQWCHNPESQSFLPQVSFRRESCINCGKCRKLLPGIECRRFPEKCCSGCGVCVKECPGGALTLLGRKVTVQEVMQTVVRDKFFYQESGGGLTLSGGEPLVQADFSASVLNAAKSENIQTAVETSGAVPWKNFEKVLPWCDLWLFDIKAAPERYTELTGGDYALVKNNLLQLLSAGEKVILRVPLVYRANCEDGLLNELITLSQHPGVAGVDILPYHDMGKGKSTMCGRMEPEWEKFSAPLPEVVDFWKQKLAKA